MRTALTVIGAVAVSGFALIGLLVVLSLCAHLRWRRRIRRAHRELTALEGFGDAMRRIGETATELKDKDGRKW